MLPHDEAGSGPAVVLLHAGVGDRRMWAEHLQPLADAGYRAIAFDLPGFGDAEIVPGPQAPWADVVLAMNELGLDRAALVGNSFGGGVALRIAALAPGRVPALALVSAPAPGLVPSPELEAVWEVEEAALDRGDVDAAVQAVVDTWTLPDAPPELREQIAAMQRRAIELQTDVEATEAPDPLEDDPDALASIETPTLVVTGAHDMPDFIEGADQMAAALPNARYALIEDAGHLAPLETPDEFRELLLGFLSRDARP